MFLTLHTSTLCAIYKYTIPASCNRLNHFFLLLPLPSLLLIDLFLESWYMRIFFFPIFCRIQYIYKYIYYTYAILRNTKENVTAMRHSFMLVSVAGRCLSTVFVCLKMSTINTVERNVNGYPGNWGRRKCIATTVLCSLVCFTRCFQALHSLTS